MYCGWETKVSRGTDNEIVGLRRRREKAGAVEHRRCETYPSALSQAVEAKLVCDLGGIHGVLRKSYPVSDSSKTASKEMREDAYGKILLVSEDEEDSVPQLVLVEHALELLPGLDNTIAIVAIDDEDDTLGVLEVVSPERTDLVLTADVPHGELDVLVLDRLDVEAWESVRQRRERDTEPAGSAIRGEGERGWTGGQMRDIPMVGMVVTISPSLSL